MFRERREFPVQPFKQGRQWRRGQANDAVLHVGPAERTGLKPLGTQAHVCVVQSMSPGCNDQGVLVAADPDRYAIDLELDDAATLRPLRRLPEARALPRGSTPAPWSMGLRQPANLCGSGATAGIANGCRICRRYENSCAATIRAAA